MRNFKKHIAVFFTIIIGASFYLTLFSFPANAQNQSTPSNWKIPVPQISIPTVNISDKTVKCSGEYCDIPWIGEYLAGIYKYAIGIVGILAAIMLMVGGIVWLTAGGNSGQVTQAQDYIKGSLTGLVLALLSYTILYTVNPELVSFKSIRVKMVSEKKIEGAVNLSRYSDCGKADSACADNKTSADMSLCSEDKSSTGNMCCCVRSAETGCSWSDSDTCNHNTQQVSDRTKCDSNLSAGKTCCCDWLNKTGEKCEKWNVTGNAVQQCKGDIASDSLKSLVACMQSQGVNYPINSVTGGNTSTQDAVKSCCGSGTCAHTSTSCHYGCRSKDYLSHAIDYKTTDQATACAIVNAAQACKDQLGSTSGDIDVITDYSCAQNSVNRNGNSSWGEHKSNTHVSINCPGY